MTTGFGFLTPEVYQTNADEVANALADLFRRLPDLKDKPLSDLRGGKYDELYEMPPLTKAQWRYAHEKAKVMG